MKINVKKDFNIVYEVAELMAYTYMPEEYTLDKTKKALEETGISPDKTIENIHRLIMDIVKTFGEFIIRDETDAYFFENNTAYALVTGSIMTYLYSQPQLLQNPELIDRDHFYQALLLDWFEIEVEPTDFNEIIKLIEENHWELNPAGMWQLLLLFKEPVKYLTDFIHMINRNTPAFNQTLEKFQPVMNELLLKIEQPTDYLIDVIKWGLEHLNMPTEEITIKRTLIGVGMFAMIDGDAFLAGHELDYGLSFLSGLIENKIIDLPPILKIMGDKSKFEILNFVKDTPSTNVEIAKHLNLTAATTSHHMNTLLTNGLVEIEQIDRKMIYSLSQTKIRELIANLENTFLS